MCLYMYSTVNIRVVSIYVPVLSSLSVRGITALFLLLCMIVYFFYVVVSVFCYGLLYVLLLQLYVIF